MTVAYNNIKYVTGTALVNMEPYCVSITEDSRRNVNC